MSTPDGSRDLGVRSPWEQPSCEHRCARCIVRPDAVDLRRATPTEPLSCADRGDVLRTQLGPSVLIAGNARITA